MYLNRILTVLSVLTVGAFCSCADTLTFAASGAFSSNDVPGGVAIPGSAWSLRFNADSTPMPGNAAPDGFDLPFSNLQLTGFAAEAQALQSIRVFSAANAGLLTLFFGPQTGVDPNTGDFIPELTLSGSQIYSGSTSNPVLQSGSFPIAQSLYTDNLNYDRQLAPETELVISTASSAVPEPGSFSMLVVLFPAALFLCIRKRRLANRG